MSIQNVNAKIVQIMKEHSKPQEAIPFLLELHNQQTDNNQRVVQKALFLLLENQHDWENVIKYLAIWKNNQLTSQFYQKMKMRCEQSVDSNTFLSFQQKMKEIDRLAKKYWMNFSQKKPKIQYHAHQQKKVQPQEDNTNSRASKPTSQRSIILNPKINPSQNNNNLTSKSQSFTNQNQLTKKSTTSQPSASLRDLKKKQSNQDKIDTKSLNNLPQNDNSNSYSVGTGFKRANNLNIFKLIKKQQKSKENKTQKQQEKKKFQSPPKQIQKKNEIPKEQKNQKNIILQNNHEEFDLDKNQNNDNNQEKKINQVHEVPKLKSLKKPFGLSPFRPQIKQKKFTIKGALGTSNSITHSAERRNLTKFNEFQNDFSFQQTGPRLIFQSSRKKDVNQDKIQEYKQLEEELKNQKNFQNPQSSNLSEMKSSSLNLNLNMSNNSKSLFGRSKNNLTCLFTPDELRLIRFDKVDNRFLGFHKEAQKRCDLNVMQMFDDFLKNL